MIEVLTDGVIAAAQTATGFSSTNVFFGRPNLKTTYPYLLIFGINQLFEKDSTNKHERARAQFAVRAVTLQKVQVAGEALQDVFDLGESNITVTGWTVLESIRFDLGLPPRSFGKIWTWDFDYNFWIYQAR